MDGNYNHKVKLLHKVEYQFNNPKTTDRKQS